MDSRWISRSEATYKMVQSGTVVMDESKLQENFHTGNMELMSLIICEGYCFCGTMSLPPHEFI